MRIWRPRCVLWVCGLRFAICDLRFMICVLRSKKHVPSTFTIYFSCSFKHITKKFPYFPKCFPRLFKYSAEDFPCFCNHFTKDFSYFQLFYKDFLYDFSIILLKISHIFQTLYYEFPMFFKRFVNDWFPCFFKHFTEYFHKLCN